VKVEFLGAAFPTPIYQGRDIETGEPIKIYAGDSAIVSDRMGEYLLKTHPVAFRKARPGRPPSRARRLRVANMRERIASGR